MRALSYRPFCPYDDRQAGLWYLPACWRYTTLRTHAQQLPGNKGLTATPTAAVVLALFTQVALVQLWLDEQKITQFSGVQPYHLLVCDALGLDSSWYAVPSGQKNDRDIQTP